MTQINSSFYQVGASLPVDAPSYVKRQADEEFYQKLQDGKLCYVLNSRQMGKSSLRVQTMQRLKAHICPHCQDVIPLLTWRTRPGTKQLIGRLDMILRKAAIRSLLKGHKKVDENILKEVIAASKL